METREACYDEFHLVLTFWKRSHGSKLLMQSNNGTNDDLNERLEEGLDTRALFLEEGR